MIINFKIYEGAFYSKELLDAIYSFLFKMFVDSIYIQENKLYFKNYKHHNYDICDYITMDKLSDDIKIVFRSYNTHYNIMHIIEKILKRELINSNIPFKYQEHYNNLEHGRFSSIKFKLKYYDKIVELFPKLSTDDIELYLDSQKYNL